MSDVRPIDCLAIVNRGEAAMRCIRAIKALRAQEGSSLRAVALYTDVDRDAPFVRQADAAFRLPTPHGEVAAYLDHDLLLATLARAGADAAWPGWGFVAEDPVFADRLAAAGITFLGPSGAAMRLLGDKIAAKQLAERVGVPVSPWTGGAVEDDEEAERGGRQIGYPLVVKAAAGGGGRGIRVVEKPSELAEAFRSAGSEARSAFGDGRLFLERKIVGGRHIEVQIARDVHGHTVAFGCRDCSVQRRHQKVIEEAPPPGLAPQLLALLVAAATRLADGVAYVGVGTVEFLVAGESFFFLEVNPRLQVEHGVTETLTGVDLVQLQIRIARGESIAGVVVVEHGAAIEARVCAEDPAAGFLPTPGRVARFDPALGPRVRVDTGVVAGNVIPSAFDSLIAKVIASGETRDEARARLVSALRDFDLVVEGGATNKGYLIELLETQALRAGGVDTGWLDRATATGTVAGSAFAAESLLAAAILAYQRRRRDARRNFFADTTNASAAHVPASVGQEIELSHLGSRYALEVFALGCWRYRVHLDGRISAVTLREGDAHVALLSVGGRTFRVLHDETDLGVRIEVEGYAHRFGWQTIGEVRAVTPAMVAAIHVAVGDTVEAGQALGLLEAMKMEIGFAAPVGGIVREVRVRGGQQIAAGDVLLVIDPSSDAAAGAAELRRLELPEETDPLLTPLDGSATNGIEALRTETRGVLLGYDVDPARLTRLIALLESAASDDQSMEVRRALAGFAAEIVLFADVEQLFERTPRIAEAGRTEPSNNARLRVYVRRMRARGAGLADEFLSLLGTTLAHYGIADLEHDDALERALLRIFASQQSSGPRQHLLRALLRVVAEVARAGIDLQCDAALGAALMRIATLRELVGDELADAAIEARLVIFEEPRIARQLERASAEIETALQAVESGVASFSSDAVRELAEAPRSVFERATALLEARDARQRALALAACLYRSYASRIADVHATADASGLWLVSARLDGGETVIGCSATPESVLAVVRQARDAVRRSTNSSRVAAIDVFVAGPPPQADPHHAETLAASLGGSTADVPVIVSWIARGGPDLHWTFVPEGGDYRRDEQLYDVHPAAAARLGLGRLRDFALERVATPDDVYCLHGRSRSMSGDERVFAFAEVRGRSALDGGSTAAHQAAFERSFQDAARALRTTLATRDPQRRLQWNRIVIAVQPVVRLEPTTIQNLTASLAPATHRLGIERVLVRLTLLDPEQDGAAPSPIELVITNVTGRHLDVGARTPREAPVIPATSYDRKVVEAKRRRLVYPYEILRLLAGGDGEELPRSTFEEYDLEPGASPPRAALVSGRAPGLNESAIVFGVIRTPTDKVPEGMRRVLILSDPTIGMGSLAAAECDRICAAIDLAAELALPVEWVPISSGARIAMDSGTENLDATARVVRRIVTFTQQGGVINVIVYGTNVGAQSYWNALATMLMHTRGALIMTAQAALVLTGRKALEAAGSVAAEDEVGIGGFEHIMGPNGEAHYYASDLVGAFRTLYEHYRFTYVVPGERGPRHLPQSNPAQRAVTDAPYASDGNGDFRTVGEIFDDATNPGRKRPFAMRPVMRALVDANGKADYLERWGAWVGAETAIVWDAHLGGQPVTLIGIESQSVARDGYRPLDGPSTWTGGTLFPQSSKKVARALNAASGVRPVVILANLSGFDGSPESMRKLQLEYGAEIARAVVNFVGPLLFLVVSRYHGGAYVVFSKALNDGLHAAALDGSYASVIGGGAAATVVFTREVRVRALASPAVRAAQAARDASPTRATRDAFDRALAEALLEARAALAAEFDAIHSVTRARDVGSLDAIVAPRDMRAHLIRRLAAG